MFTHTDSRLRSGTWLVDLSPNRNARIRLICFSYAGGGVSTFRQWPAYLPDAVQIVAVQLPGHDSRFNEPALTDVADVLPALADSIVHSSKLPFAFFGHSLGALMATAMAQHLQNQRMQPPCHLFVSGARPPHSVDRREIPFENLGDEDLIQELRLLGGSPDDVLKDDALMRILLPTIRADFALARSCKTDEAETLSIPMSLYSGYEDRHVTVSDLEQWRRYSHAPIPVSMFPGGHFFIDTARPLLLSVLLRTLLRACS